MRQQTITDKINTAKHKCFVCFDCLVSSALPGTDDLKAYREAEEKFIVGAVDLLRFKTEEKDHQLDDQRPEDVFKLAEDEHKARVTTHANAAHDFIKILSSLIPEVT